MKNTLRLFQLLLAVYGLYVVTEYSGDPKPFIAMACIVLIVILDRWQTQIIAINERQKTSVDTRLDQDARVKQQLEMLRQSRSTAVVSNTIQELLRGLGLTVRPSLNHPVIDYLLELPGQASHKVSNGGREKGLGLKIIHDVHEPCRDWEHWQKIKEFEEEGEGQQHVLLIAHNLVKDHKTGPPRYVNFSDQTAQILAQHRVTAMTSLSFCHLYQVCKEPNQDPQVIFRQIHQHQGGIFEI